MTRGRMEQNASYHPPVFFLTGIPGANKGQSWLVSIPFCLLYLIGLLGNGTILLTILRTPSLHEPMYYFLSMLAVTDLGLVLCTLPTTLGIFWLNIETISFNACLTQMYFIHIVSILESSVLLAMAFDRFIAISRPLRYRATLTNLAIVKMGLAMVVRAVVSPLPMPFLLQRLTYCPHKTTLSHSFCFHSDIMNLALADIRINVLYGLIVVVATISVDSVLIVLSYFMIFRTVLNLGTKGKRQKALNTCVSHICAVLILFLPMIGLSMIHRYHTSAPAMIKTMVGYIYLIVPPALNPIIYGIKSKQIRKAILKVLIRKTDPS